MSSPPANRPAVDRRADLIRLVRRLRREAIAAGAEPKAVATWSLEQLLADRRRTQLAKLTQKLRAELLHLGAPRAQVNTWPLEQLIRERRRLLDDLIERPGKGAGCQT